MILLLGASLRTSPRTRVWPTWMPLDLQGSTDRIIELAAWAGKRRRIRDLSIESGPLWMPIRPRNVSETAGLS